MKIGTHGECYIQIRKETLDRLEKIMPFEEADEFIDKSINLMIDLIHVNYLRATKPKDMAHRLVIEKK